MTAFESRMAPSSVMGRHSRRFGFAVLDERLRGFFLLPALGRGLGELGTVLFSRFRSRLSKNEQIIPDIR